MTSQEAARIASLRAEERGQLMFGLFAKGIHDFDRITWLCNGGSDGVALVAFAKSVQKADEAREVLTPASDALNSHLLCFGAEEARVYRTIVDMTDFRQRAEKEADSL